MAKEYIGTILAYGGTPSIEKAYFQLEDKCVVHTGQFVSIEHDLPIFGMITGIFRANPFFEQLHVDFDNLKDKFPTSEWNKTLVEIKLLGQIKNNKSTRILNPPFAGALVNFASAEQIRNFFGFAEDGLHLGNIELDNTKQVPVKINMSKLLQKHLAILAMSGAGKSYTISVLLEELLNIDQNAGPLGVVLFDVHGEYKNFAEPSSKEYVSYHNKTRYFDASTMKFALHSLNDSLLFKFLGSISETQQRELLQILRKFKEDDNKKVFDLNDLIQFVSESKDIKENVKIPLLGWLSLAESQNIFAKTSTFDIFKLAEPGKLTIIDLSNVLNMHHKQMVVAYISNKLFELRRENKVCPFLIILEEAHQFVPQSGSEEYMKARPIFETIAREGRKFGCALCLVSQRPINLSTTVLSQCNTHMLLRIINPNDLQHISESSEGLDTSSIKLITGLSVGEALLVGSSVKYPVFFKVRERKSSPNKFEKDLNEMSKEFIEKKESDNKDLDLYM